MAAAAVAVPQVVKVRAAPARPKVPAEHPKYSEMVSAAISDLKERGGSSRQAILKYIMGNYKVGTNEAAVNSHLKMALKAGVKGNTLRQAKGTGASGSFRMGEKKAVKKAAKPKKPAAKKAKKVTKAATKPKKATPKKKTPVKKSPASKPKAAKKPSKPKVTKKTSKPKAAKKSPAKKAAAKKPAKKAAKK